MFKYKIRNPDTGVNFEVCRDELGDMQPEWGSNPQIEKIDLTPPLPPPPPPAPPGPSKEEILAQKWKELRKERNAALAATDWCMLGDAPLDKEEKAIMANYRNALRRLPENSHDPDQLELPEYPKL